MSGQTQHWPVKTSNLPDKCPMSGANLQACCVKTVVERWLVNSVVLNFSRFASI